MPQSARSWGRLQPSLLEPREWTLWPHGGCGVGRQPRGPPRRQGPQAFQNDLICSAQEFDKMIVPAHGGGSPGQEEGGISRLSTHRGVHSWTRVTWGAQPPD